MVPVLRNTQTPSVLGPMNRLDSLFDRVFGEDGMHTPTRPALPLSLWEDDDNLYVEAELPGLSDGDVDVTIHRGVLTIRCERKAAEERRALYDDRAYGRFERTIKLPELVDSENVQAKMKDGLLSLALPKRPESKPRKIQVQAE